MPATFFSINAWPARLFIITHKGENKQKHDEIMKRNIWLNLGMAAVLTAMTSGCTTWADREHHRANSLYNYLYAGKPGHVDVESIPVLNLPLRIGIAFVPPDSPRKKYLF